MYRLTRWPIGKCLEQNQPRMYVSCCRRILETSVAGNIPKRAEKNLLLSTNRTFSTLKMSQIQNRSHHLFGIGPLHSPSLPIIASRFKYNQLYFSTSPKYNSPNNSSANRTTLKYVVAIAIAVVGLSYAAVPLYRVFCQASGYGGTVALAEASEKVENMEPIREREITIRFNADTSAAMLWQFKPHQREIKVVPGETALAFYTACNTTDKPVTGIATYNVVPFEAGLYFNKIQCFCFEEQRLNPNEQVDMPVFFYIDPEFNDDPAMARVDKITLSYTFFEAKEGENLQATLPATG